MICHLHDHDRCRELFARLSDYIDGDMDAFARRTFEAHLADCLGCHSCVQALRRTIALCKHTARQPVPAPLSERLGQLPRGGLKKPPERPRAV
jgi:anti-sigma factor RsiW